MTGEVITLVLANDPDPWAFVQPFVWPGPLALMEVLTVAAAGWTSPRWRNGVFVAALLTPLSLLAHAYPLWYMPLSVIAVLNASHFVVLLTAYSVAFGLKRLLRRIIA
jgi:hypothetical protein